MVLTEPLRVQINTCTLVVVVRFLLIGFYVLVLFDSSFSYWSHAAD